MLHRITILLRWTSVRHFSHMFLLFDIFQDLILFHAKCSVSVALGLRLWLSSKIRRECLNCWFHQHLAGVLLMHLCPNFCLRDWEIGLKSVLWMVILNIMMQWCNFTHLIPTTVGQVQIPARPYLPISFYIRGSVLKYRDCVSMCLATVDGIVYFGGGTLLWISGSWARSC